MEPQSSLARAGFAILQLTEDGALRHAVYAAVPRNLPQTSLMAEVCALALAGELGKGITVSSDCQKVVSDWEDGQEVNCHHRSKLACSWRMIGDSGRDRNIANVRKVKAHRDLELVSDKPEDILDFIGNAYADEHARKGALLHDFDMLTEAEYNRQSRKVKKLMLHMATVISQWPAPGNLQKIASEKAMAQQLATRTAH